MIDPETLDCTIRELKLSNLKLVEKFCSYYDFVRIYESLVISIVQDMSCLEIGINYIDLIGKSPQ